MIGKKNIVFGFLFLVLTAALGPYMVKTMLPTAGEAQTVRVTATGKLIRQRAFGSHLLTKKSANRKRKLRKAAQIVASDTSRLRSLLGR